MKGEVANKKIFPLLKEQPVPRCLQPVFALDNITLETCSWQPPWALWRGSLGAVVSGVLHSRALPHIILFLDILSSVFLHQIPASAALYFPHVAMLNFGLFILHSSFTMRDTPGL